MRLTATVSMGGGAGELSVKMAELVALIADELSGIERECEKGAGVGQHFFENFLSKGGLLKFRKFRGHLLSSGHHKESGAL